YEASFIQFMQQSKICVVNGDEIAYRDEHILTFGRNENNDVIFSYDSGKVTILRKTFDLPIKGIKYAYDFVGAYLVAKLLNVKDFQIQYRMKQFKMPKRRFECTQCGSQWVISDYAHHPEEIQTIYEALVEQYPHKKKICIFEPHTLTRLKYFVEDYKTILKQFDECYLYPLFSSARETHNIVLEQELYRNLGYPIYSSLVQKQLSHKKDIVLCFLG
ncbi:MAG: hypothetical protein K2N65_05380, partial [Anaeroplasmataceae bacterium]|nr:hypothetical protein [Anaeroplasmataceae bacterium]